MASYLDARDTSVAGSHRVAARNDVLPILDLSFAWFVRWSFEKDSVEKIICLIEQYIKAKKNCIIKQVYQFLNNSNL